MVSACSIRFVDGFGGFVHFELRFPNDLDL